MPFLFRLCSEVAEEHGRAERKAVRVRNAMHEFKCAVAKAAFAVTLAKADKIGQEKTGRAR